MRLLLISLELLLFASSLPAAGKPNVIVLLADDQGWGDLSANGNTNLRTPHIDSLAKDGARFERFFVQPVCSPTRAEFLTGRYHPRGGVSGVSTGAERLNLNERTLAQDFQDAGYSTACFGKWHNGSQYPYHPLGRGFEEYFGFTSGHWADYFNAPLDHNGKAVRGKGFLADEITQRAIDFCLGSHQKKQPFFCFVAFNTPHSPMQVPDPYWKRFAQAELKLRGLPNMKEDLEHTRAALAMCENLDDNVGKLLQAIRDQKLEEETIVLYLTDNGPNGGRWNGGMKGRKGSTDEGGVRSPLHIRWTKQIPPGTVVEPIGGAIDLKPTLLKMCGLTTKNADQLDGIDLSQWIRGQGATALPDRVLFQHWAGKTSARNQQYRLDTSGGLFDLLNDPGQKKEIGKEQPEIQKKLTSAVENWKREVLAQAEKQRPFTVGYSEMPRTVLPARDGQSTGTIQRSASAPNCSYFINWTKAEDRIKWSISVSQPGEYEAILWYTCAESDVGSKLILDWNQTRWTGKIATAFESPLRGKEQDRVPRRGESYMKDFASLSLGKQTLKPGEGTLILSAEQVTGKQVADVRAVELILLSPK
jgi:arylsulfatase A-like enzyme